MFRPSTTTLFSIAVSILLLAGATQVQAHIAPWTRGIWECTDGTDQNNGEPANPLYNRPKAGPNGWWFHGEKCIKNRPPLEQFLELPAGGTFMVEFSGNRAFTSLSYNGTLAKGFGEGEDEPGYGQNGPCISSPNLHAKHESDASGYAFAISYQSDISKVTLENLVVFTTKYNTPFRRVATYDVPADMPECPPGDVSALLSGSQTTAARPTNL